ncbi:cell division protein SepF [Corynebacterium sp. S7]
MSFMKGAKEFFGFTPDTNDYDAYYDEPRYDNDGSAAYAPEVEREPAYARADAGHRYGRSETVVAEPRNYAPTIVVVEPRSFDDAKDIGEPFRDGDAVIMELTELDRALQKRMVDFAAGLCFALRGQMHNLGKYSDTDRMVFAVVPEDARTTTLELERAAGLR